MKGIVQTAISRGLSPQEAAVIYAELDSDTANGVAAYFTGVADGDFINDVGKNWIAFNKQSS